MGGKKCIFRDTANRISNWLNSCTFVYLLDENTAQEEDKVEEEALDIFTSLYCDQCKYQHPR